jgi:hypothetical protein
MRFTPARWTLVHLVPASRAAQRGAASGEGIGAVAGRDSIPPRRPFFSSASRRRRARRRSRRTARLVFECVAMPSAPLPSRVGCIVYRLEPVPKNRRRPSNGQRRQRPLLSARSPEPVHVRHSMPLISIVDASDMQIAARAVQAYPSGADLEGCRPVLHGITLACTRAVFLRREPAARDAGSVAWSGGRRSTRRS